VNPKCDYSRITNHPIYGNNIGVAMRTKISVRDGFQIAIRHPRSGSAILAKTFSKLLKKEDWISEQFKLKLCIMFVENLIDGSIEKSINRDFFKRLKQKTFTEGIKLLDEGMKYLVVIVMEELRLNQNFNDKQQYEFYEVLLNSFFSGYTVSDFIPDGKI